jgi:hypothetical protein
MAARAVVSGVPSWQRFGGRATSTVSLPVSASGTFETSTAAIATAGTQALVAIEEPLFLAYARQIAELAMQNRLAMMGFKPHAEAGRFQRDHSGMPRSWPHMQRGA